MIDIVIYDHTPANVPLNQQLRLANVAGALQAFGLEVRTVVIVNADTGLTGTKYIDRGGC